MADVTRRSALTAGGFVVAGGVAGFVIADNSDAANEESTGQANAYTPPKPKKGTPAKPPTPLADAAAIPSGGGVILKSKGVVLTKNSAGTVRAFTTSCPHQGCTVFQVKSGTIDCPCHGSKFDVNTGKVVAGPAPHGLDVVPVKVTAGKVYPA